MKTDTLIVGGGLTGLSLARQLQRAGHDFQLIEAAPRLGGRIKSFNVNGSAFDLGPSWVWPGQAHVAKIISELGLRTFAQWEAGAQLYEQPDGDVIANQGFMSMAGSLRITGGTTALIDAIVSELDPARLHLSQAAVALTADPCGVQTVTQFIAAQRIILAVPPRIALTLSFAPELPSILKTRFGRIPTWMAAHAKFVAVYDKPFWREAGLSGDASSRRGPLVEIHDASPADGTLGGLFGFVGIPAAARVGAETAVTDAALVQLTRLFGDQAASPVQTVLKDWSQAPETATLADMTPPHGHPEYGLRQEQLVHWNGKLIFSVTELSKTSGGLIDGALAAGARAAEQVLSA